MTRKKYQPPSKIAARVYKALLLTNYTILTEFPVGERLEVDFVIREIALACEVDGRQHTEYNSFHYDGKDAFRAAKSRDQRKAVLCEQQGLNLIRLSEKEVMGAASPEELLALILSKASQQKTESEEEEW